MKKIVSRLACGIMALGMAVSGLALGAGAEEEVSDVKLDCSTAVEMDAWHASMQFNVDAFDATRMTKDSVIKVNFDFVEKYEDGEYPVELIFQSWSYPDDTPAVRSDGGVWGRVKPSKVEDGYEEFSYEDIIAYDADTQIGYGRTILRRLTLSYSAPPTWARSR